MVNKGNQNQLVELTRENFEEIIKNANSFRDLAYASHSDSIGSVSIPDAVTMFNMHIALELILKALRFTLTGEIDKKSHKLEVAYNKQELSVHHSQLESLYHEAISKYESQQSNISRRIAENSIEEKKYDPSNLLETLKTIDSMNLYLQRYSHEQEDNWIILEDFQFLFLLFDKLCEYVENDYRRYTVQLGFDGLIKEENPDGTVSYFLNITKIGGKDFRKANPQFEIIGNGMMKITLTPQVSSERDV